MQSLRITLWLPASRPLVHHASASRQRRGLSSARAEHRRIYAQQCAVIFVPNSDRYEAQISMGFRNRQSWPPYPVPLLVGLAELSDAVRQEMTEAYLIQAALTGAHRERAKGNRASLARIATAVRQGAGASRLNLSGIELTDDGFVLGRFGASDIGFGIWMRYDAVRIDAPIRTSVR